MDIWTTQHRNFDVPDMQFLCCLNHHTDTYVGTEARNAFGNDRSVENGVHWGWGKDAKLQIWLVATDVGPDKYMIRPPMTIAIGQGELIERCSALRGVKAETKAHIFFLSGL